MATITVTLPDPMSDWAREGAASADYDDPSDYVRALIRADRERRQKLARLQAEITKGVESGTSPRTLDDIWADVKARHGIAD